MKKSIIAAIITIAFSTNAMALNPNQSMWVHQMKINSFYDEVKTHSIQFFESNKNCRIYLTGNLPAGTKTSTFGVEENKCVKVNVGVYFQNLEHKYKNWVSLSAHNGFIFVTSKNKETSMEVCKRMEGDSGKLCHFNK